MYVEYTSLKFCLLSFSIISSVSSSSLILPQSKLAFLIFSLKSTSLSFTADILFGAEFGIFVSWDFLDDNDNRLFLGVWLFSTPSNWDIVLSRTSRNSSLDWKPMRSMHCLYWGDSSILDETQVAYSSLICKQKTSDLFNASP